ncbi:vitamin-D-receptor interacting mediator subunit 4-domain-containing protein [Mycotypha africana]|uniref:vitamin-D-receptor interacting mediator subunit 4-domain-containing protein n=1 Tax=Mycotypha africana TaxID=64632 RepID=UPI002301723E|nr:vitamin-D-receptor interacting mediator subunit 4-domain-containing protein [Mycotypha africana]KAI8970439.1 vitamin-D-receptor interacting mediator subunit 4-domain-containing protein [Mycotypha africana]
METTSLREQVSEHITEFSDYIRKYFLALSAVAENNIAVDKVNSPEEIAKQMALVDKKLQLAVEEIENHQIRQRQIIDVQEEIQQHNLALLNLIQNLGSVREDLDKSLAKAKIELKAIKYANESQVQFTDVLSYASKLAKYTSAPPNFDLAARDVRVDFEKPYPDEERMRRGLLYWQNTPRQETEEKFERSDSDESGVEEMEDIDMTKQAEDTGGDQFWVLDLNPDMQT